MHPADPVEAWAFGALGSSLALFCLFFAFRTRSRERLLRMLPTVKARGVFIGFVEIKGVAHTRRPLTSYLTDQPCVHYSWSVEEHWSRQVTETYRDSDGRMRTRTRTESGWRTVAEGGEMIPFFLRDETGVVRVDPRGAKIEPGVLFNQDCNEDDPLYYEKGPADAVAHSDYRRRFVENGIPLGTWLYVVGQSRERRDVIAPEIAYDQESPLFLITVRNEQQIRSGMGWSSWGLAFLALLLAAAGTLLGPARRFEPPPVFIAAGAAFVFCWILGWVWMVYNSLVGLRQRVRRAGSLIDVQLKRRHDLIPALVAVVQGFRDYEATVQKEVAALRTQLEATPFGRPGPDPAALLPAVRAIVERYPNLKADESFLALQKSLSDTEQRIALARSYFNEIASHYNSCLEVVPDRFVAALGALRPEALFTAQDFERAPVAVDLDQNLDERPAKT